MSSNQSKSHEIEEAKAGLSKQTSDHILEEVRMQTMLLCAASDETMGAIEAAFDIDRVDLVIKALRQVAAEFEEARTTGGHRIGRNPAR
jgi:hypothetical protein